MVGKPLEERPLGRPKGRWEVNVKTYLRKTGCEDGSWMEMVLYLDYRRVLLLAVLSLKIPLQQY